MDRRMGQIMMPAERKLSLHLPVANILTNPRQDWGRIASKGGRAITARSVEVDWKKFNSEQFLFSHVTAVSSVETEDDGFTIKPACVGLVNSNGNAWTNEVLLATFRTFIGGDNFLEHCFAAGTRVLMSDGTYKEIQEVRPNDVVINRLGNPSKVKNIQKKWSDSIFRMSSKDILCRDMFVTGNHPFWVFHARETCPKTGRPNMFGRDKDFFQLSSWTGFSYGVHKRKGESFDCGVTSSWINAENINPNRDFLTHPVSDRVVENTEINEKRAELIGWFLAEGSYSHVNIFSDDDSGVVFNLGNDENDVAERIKTLLIEEFGNGFRKNCEPRIYETESGSFNVYLCNKTVAEFFFKWCGKYSWAKKLSPDALWLPKKLQAIILKHCLNGDGTGETKSRGYSIALKSKDLIQQLIFISWRLGICPTYREVGVLPRYTDLEIVDGYEVFTDPITGKKSRPGYGLWFTVRDSKTFNDILGISDLRIDSRASNARTHIFANDEGRWLVSKVTDVKKENIGCEVFNLEVEDDNSYIAEGVVVHNCQIKELSKGKILDAVLRPLLYVDEKGRTANVYYCDLLVATDRKHTSLVRKILSGELNTLSMGTLCDFVTCSKCGKVMGDSEPNCSHIENEIRELFITKNGEQSIIAEMCGRVLWDKQLKKWVGDPKSNKFIEISWVEHPAFVGAVLNHYVSEIPKEAAGILAMKTADLQLAMDDIFKLRVADKRGMLVLRVAQAEIANRMREGRVSKIARRMM
jgi:hypothetical protein